mgnify:CR=1 FL=1
MLVAVLAMLGCKEQASEMTMEEETMEAPDYAEFDKKVATTSEREVTFDQVYQAAFPRSGH